MITRFAFAAAICSNLSERVIVAVFLSSVDIPLKYKFRVWGGGGRGETKGGGHWSVQL